MFSKPGERYKLTDSIISISSNQRKYRENLVYIAKFLKIKDKEKFLKPAGENYFTIFKETAVDHFNGKSGNQNIKELHL